jgi:hypothetical protein
VPDFCEEGASDPVVGLAGAPLSLAPLQRPSVSCEGTLICNSGQFPGQGRGHSHVHGQGIRHL